MKRSLALIALTLVALAVAGTASASSSYDRKPATVYGLYGDGWGINISDAAYNLKHRYHGITTAYCIGAIMANGSDSSWLDGNPPQRLWDKVACGGYTAGSTWFTLIYDQKGPNSWVIYRLKGVTINALRYG
jgi:hypothetical protein